ERQLNQWPLDSFDHQGVKVIEIHVTGSAEVILEFVADNLFEGQLIHVQVSAPGFVLQSKILGKQNGAGGEHGGPDEGVLQLANVAWPRVLFQKFLRFRRNAGGLDAHFAVDLVDEVADQEWDIASALPQRRQVDRDDFETKVEIFAEAFVFDRSLEVLVCG